MQNRGKATMGKTTKKKDKKENNEEKKAIKKKTTINQTEDRKNGIGKLDIK